MWLSELEKGMTVWMYGLSDYWNVYSATVVGWSAESVYLDNPEFYHTHFTRLISSVSAEPLEPKPVPGGYIGVQS